MSSNSKDKRVLREYWKSQYSNYRSFFPDWNREICRLLISNPKFQSAQKVALFYPRDWEVDLLPLWKQRSAVCGFPKTDPKTWRMQFFSVNSLQSPDFVQGVGGVFEPVAEDNRKLHDFQPSDLILVPGLMFDKLGARVGSGKGVYDRFLAHEGKLAQKWGVAFSPQVVSQNINRESHDVLMDGLVTEKGFIYF